LCFATKGLVFQGETAETPGGDVIAIRCGAWHIFVENLKDRPADMLCEFAVDAIEADEVYSRIFKHDPTPPVAALKIMRHVYRNSPSHQSEFVFQLPAQGLPKLASRLRSARALL
jgi:hypothetical protein